MNLQYLSLLTTVNSDTKSDYTIVKNQNDNYESFIMDNLDFTYADRNNDNFLNYGELANVRLSAIFNVRKDTFEFQRGFNLLSNKTIKKTIDHSGLSRKLLLENFKELDKNSDNTITTNEVDPNFTNIVDNQKRDYKAFKKHQIDKKVTNEAKNINGSKQVDALNKQIQTLKKMLHSLEAKQIQEPEQVNIANKNNTKDISNTGIEKTISIKNLQNKYGTDNVNKLINTISRTPHPSVHISSVIYQSGTQASEKEVTQLVGLIQGTVLNKISVQETSDLNAIEQLSPANSPLVLDSKNINLSIQSVKEKIQDLEGMKDKILQKEIT